MTTIVGEKPAVIIRPTTLLSTKPSFGTMLLALIVLLSGLTVIYVADLNRRVFMELEQAQETQNQLHIDWGKLLLEQSTWSTQARIESIAQRRLGMQAPNNTQIISSS